ncbi:HAD family phosphatase [Nocardia seriolae]|nr:HAD family phosphatase [Nocardia seriolae]MTJ62703.1 HAD-IA family hydrolase [Nocardia seriolae]MTJ74815.1 HAD-IA family hydrolase [Nocardia seriolae]MTJ87740.1 HAD-IA family hydrolase [Nocardia seriolae]MTK31733.1 HAD-IA family hydrolase [Nocardia seriolae]MTK40636.1 HAD-IA family hydrolase [Nocardia seriolae]
MDGLLLDSERLAVESLALSGGELGYELSEQFCHSLIGMPADTCRELAVAAFGPDFPLDEFFRRHETVIARLVDDGRLTTKPGVTDLLDELDRRAVPRAIATSSGSDRTRHHLRAVGLSGRFGAIVTRHDVQRGKPHPEPYLTATAALGADPQYTLACEDSPNGLRAAHAAGLRCLLIPDLIPATAETTRLAHRVYPDLLHVIDYSTTANDTR